MNSLRIARPAGFVLIGVLLGTVLMACKSGPPRGQVSGKVTFKGNPVTEGTVTFHNPKAGHAGEAKLGPGGSYVITTVEGGLVVGDYGVMITPLTHIVDLEPGKTPPVDVEKPAPDIPKKYRRQETSALKAQVKEGKNVFDFDMKP